MAKRIVKTIGKINNRNGTARRRDQYAEAAGVDHFERMSRNPGSQVSKNASGSWGVDSQYRNKTLKDSIGPYSHSTAAKSGILAKGIERKAAQRYNDNLRKSVDGEPMTRSQAARKINQDREMDIPKARTSTATRKPATTARKTSRTVKK